MLQTDIVESTSPPGPLLRLARRKLLSIFSSLPHGSLSIQEPDGNQIRLGKGNPHGHLIISDWRSYQLLLSGGSLGAAQAYMANFWDSDNLTDVIRYFAINIDVTNKIEGGIAQLGKPLLSLWSWLNRNSLQGSLRNISAHYDLGNEFFSLFLDPSMMYSSAVFPEPNASLARASTYKLDLICQKLGLNETHHLLEVGTGWGGLAIHAAQHYGCRVTTTTISQQQYQYAKQRVTEMGLADRITLLDQDYRLLEGQFDRVVSVEMIEAVGHQYLPTYFKKLNQLLTDDGLLLIQAITIPQQRYKKALKEVDFIKRYIFPGGFLPSQMVIQKNLAQYTRLQPLHSEDIGIDYARTLSHWKAGFNAAKETILSQGFDDTFLRMWNYYFSYCEGAFLERAIGTVQLLAAAPGYRPAPCD